VGTQSTEKKNKFNESAISHDETKISAQTYVRLNKTIFIVYQKLCLVRFFKNAVLKQRYLISLLLFILFFVLACFEVKRSPWTEFE
jgi:hypothetical protein